MKNLFRLGLLSTVVVFGCSKEKEVLKESAIDHSAMSVSGMVDFALPEEVNSGNDQSDLVIRTMDIYGADDNGDELYMGQISYSFRGDDLLSVTLSSTIYNFINEHDEHDEFNTSMFTSGQFKTDLIDDWQLNGGGTQEEPTSGIMTGLRNFFWGKPLELPCVLGQGQDCWDHWLVGVHSCRLVHPRCN